MQKPTQYNAWRRGLGNQCYTTDIDFIEYRFNPETPNQPNPVAIIEVTGNLNDEEHIMKSKKYVWFREKNKLKIMKELSQKLGIPAYYVMHTKELNLFHVHNLKDLLCVKRLNQQQYTEFIKNLELKGGKNI